MFEGTDARSLGELWLAVGSTLEGTIVKGRLFVFALFLSCFDSFPVLRGCEQVAAAEAWKGSQTWNQKSTRAS